MGRNWVERVSQHSLVWQHHRGANFLAVGRDTRHQITHNLLDTTFGNRAEYARLGGNVQFGRRADFVEPVLAASRPHRRADPQGHVDRISCQQSEMLNDRHELAHRQEDSTRFSRRCRTTSDGRNVNGNPSSQPRRWRHFARGRWCSKGARAGLRTHGHARRPVPQADRPRARGRPPTARNRARTRRALAGTAHGAAIRRGYGG